MAVYVVTGGAGFIGRHLVESLLKDGHQVRIIDNLSTGRPENVPIAARLLVADINDRATLREAMADAEGCFHLAAVASVQRCTEDWVGSHDTNLRGTLQVFECAADIGMPVVYASSAAVYGNCAEMPLKETAPTRPLSAYGADKLGCELHARAAGLVHRLPTYGLRFFNVYGPGQDPSSPYSGVISIFANRILRGEAVTLFGSGTQVRDFIYVGDIVRALRAALENARLDAPVSNVCTGLPTSVRHLAMAVGQILGTGCRLIRGPARDGDIEASIGCPEHLRQDLGVVAQWSLEEGLALTLEALRAAVPPDRLALALRSPSPPRASQLPGSASGLPSAGTLP